MNIYWRQWLKPPMSKEDAKAFAEDIRRYMNRIRDERIEMEKVAKRIEKAVG